MTDLKGPFVHPQSPLEQQSKNSQWQPVGETEESIRQQSRIEIDHLERDINLGQRMLALKNAPGFQQFIEAVEEARERTMTELEGCSQGNELMRIIQGRSQAYSSILVLVRNAEQKLESLANKLAVARANAAALIRPDGKVVPEPMVGGF